MDGTDRAILDELQDDARISYRDLGRRIGLSANATADRVRRLRRTGVIRGFTALVDPGAADPHRLTVLIDIRLRPDVTAEQFEAALRQIPAVTEALHVTGSFDYLARATIPDAAHLDQLIRALKHTAGAAGAHTRLALRSALAGPNR